MYIKNLQDAKIILGKYNEKIIGIESSAFLIYFPGLFLKNFKIISYKDSLDILDLKKHFKIKTLNTIIPGKVSRISILENSDIKKYIKKENTKYIITRKETAKAEKLINSLNIKLLGNNSSSRVKYENKKSFREILTEIGVNPILGENINIDRFLESNYKDWVKKYGNKLVIQIPEISKGGGSGTLFINKEEDFYKFKKSIHNKIFKNKIIKSINITKYIDGTAGSIIGCATKQGILTNCVQTQIIDIPEVISKKKGSGLFCGHDRSFKHYSKNIQIKADKIAKKIGSHMFANGYKGIFGLDLIIDEKNENVYIVECNSRYTGAMPMLSMLDIKHGNIPMDVFHLLEHLNIPYKINFSKIDKSYKNSKEGSHIILSNKSEDNIICKKEIISGVYTIKKGELKYIRDGYEYNDIKEPNEFIITDGNPRKGQIIKGYKESSRICHLLFPSKILKSKTAINNKCKNIIDTIYNFLF